MSATFEAGRPARQGRQLTTTILKNAATANTTEKKTALIDAMKAALVLYRAHTSQEDTDLFPTLRSLVTPVQFEEISGTTDKKLRDAFGRDGLDKVAKRIEALERKIGVHELGPEAKPKD
jgi:hemerythrin-like domain-containing protein